MVMRSETPLDSRMSLHLCKPSLNLVINDSPVVSLTLANGIYGSVYIHIYDTNLLKIFFIAPMAYL